MSLDRLGYIRKKVIRPDDNRPKLLPHCIVSTEKTITKQQQQQPQPQQQQPTLKINSDNFARHIDEDDDRLSLVSNSSTVSSTAGSRVKFDGTFFSTIRHRKPYDFTIHPDWVSERLVTPTNTPSTRSSFDQSCMNLGLRVTLLRTSATMPSIRRSSSAPPMGRNPITWESWWS